MDGIKYLERRIALLERLVEGLEVIVGRNQPDYIQEQLFDLNVEYLNRFNALIDEKANN